MIPFTKAFPIKFAGMESQNRKKFFSVNDPRVTVSVLEVGKTCGLFEILTASVVCILLGKKLIKSDRF